MMRIQRPHDKVLRELNSHSAKMMRSMLMRSRGIEYAVLDPILEELIREGKVRIPEDMIILA
jgi:hypothetical protein